MLRAGGNHRLGDIESLYALRVGVHVEANLDLFAVRVQLCPHRRLVRGYEGHAPLICVGRQFFFSFLKQFIFTSIDKI